LSRYNACPSLTTIYASDKFVIGSSALTTDMFTDNIRLIGSQGTVYNKDIIDGTYAKVDGGEQSKGYFSAKGVSLPAVTSIAIKTMPVNTYSLTEAFTTAYGVASVTFSGRSAQDIDLSVCTITSTYDSTQVGKYTITATFNGKSTTYTVDVVDRDDVFCTREGDTLYVYYGKYKSDAWLLSQYPSASKSSVYKMVIEPSFCDYTPTSYSYKFGNFTNMVKIDGLENMNLSNVTAMDNLFSFNTTLETLDLSTFDTKNVTDMSSMFARCSSLKTIYVGSKWSTASVTKSVDMFYNCTALEGSKGTKFDSEKVDVTYARADKGTSSPGYFTLKEPITPITLRVIPSTVKTAYLVGDVFKCDGGLISITYSDNSIDTLSLCNAEISEVLTDKVGLQLVTVTYLGLSTSLSIVVTQSEKVADYTPPMENGVYQLSTVEDLFWFITQVNNGNNKLNVVLTQDIVVNQNCLSRLTLTKAGNTESELIAWQPIGTIDYPFEGTFNGQGHSISGLYLNDKTQDNVGLFGIISEDAVVKNVGLEDSFIMGNENVGSICGNNQGTIANCYNTSIVKGSQNVGAISGSVTKDAVVVNSYSVGRATTTDGEEQGISGVASENVKNCYYLTEKTDNTDEQAKTAAEFKSGEVLKTLVEGAKTLAEESNNNEKFVLEVFDLNTELPGVDEIEQPNDPDNPSTPVLEVSSNSVRIWSYDKTVFIENAESEIHIISLSGTTICRLVPESSHIEINLLKTGIYIVKTGKVTQKVAIQ
ncbi:MAG: BspA family leucine-rich repeat surface protein, partial [Bacteroidales bacterium]|nr:BspA family leucine-rich repeat surface protein [Bacteroidales bacterium]